jgi:uncharacterized protein
MIKEAQLVVKVIPKSSQSAIVGWEGNTLKIRLKAVPEKGEANDELIAFLAKTLHTAKSNIILTHGQTSRVKRLRIIGFTKEELVALFK